jgi:hypothetical protein
MKKARAGFFAQAQPFLAVLPSEHPEVNPITLVREKRKAGKSQVRAIYCFEPFRHFAERRALLGLIRPAKNQTLEVTAFKVRPAADGQAEVATLQLICPAPRDLAAWPKPQRAGVMKAIGRALADMCTEAEPSLAQWWLACQLALRGCIPRTEWKACWQQIGGRQLEFGPRIEQQGAYLCWREFLDLRLHELRNYLGSDNRNPLLNELTPEVVNRVLKHIPPVICGRLLELLAEQHDLRLEYWHGEAVVRLEGELAAPEPPLEDSLVIGEIMDAFATGHGAARNILEERHPSHLHVIRWLFDAGWLVETGDGYVFTRNQLDRLLTKVLAWDLPPAQIGVGTIKNRLGLARRRAEALRAYLVEQFPDERASRSGAEDD